MGEQSVERWVDGFVFSSLVPPHRHSTPSPGVSPHSEPRSAPPPQQVENIVEKCVMWSGVGKSSTGLSRWDLRRGAFTNSVGWQVIRCDPVWQVTLRESRSAPAPPPAGHSADRRSAVDDPGQDAWQVQWAGLWKPSRCYDVASAVSSPPLSQTRAERLYAPGKNSAWLAKVPNMPSRTTKNWARLAEVLPSPEPWGHGKPGPPGPTKPS